jgi:DNA-binding transcriptional regulator GbsR (MarR family)
MKNNTITIETTEQEANLLRHVQEYFKVKKVVKDFNADLRDYKKEHELTPRIEELKKELKKLKTELAVDKMVMDMKEDLDSSKERMTLLKDIITQEMLETGQEEVFYEGKKLRLVKLLKESSSQLPMPNIPYAEEIKLESN